MEYINKVELAGRVGSINVTQTTNGVVGRISLVTNKAFTSQDGEPMVISTWHRLVAWERQGVELSFIEKGTQLHITGELRNYKYTGSDGVERSGIEIYVDSLDVIK